MVAVAASPTPGAAASFSGKPNQHPPYKDMIVSAIEALKVRKGSSRKAISKYIADNYSGLPSTHAALLTHHLRRLQQRGDLTMLKHSFKLPDPSASVGSKKRGRPPKNPNPSPSVTEPRRRGRPSKSSEEMKSPAAVDPSAVYILPQAEQLNSGFFRSLPGAVAIILPEGLLSKKTCRSPVLILPNGVQSLVEASGSQKKLGRPRKHLIQKKQHDDPKEPEKIQTILPRRKAVVPKQLLLLNNGHTNNDGANAAAKRPGRPRKNGNSALSENSLPESPDAKKPTIVKVVQDKPSSPGFQLKKRASGKNSESPDVSKVAVEKPATTKIVQLTKSSPPTAKIVQEKPKSPGSESKKKSVGRPRKNASPLAL